jgi:hypothetical protein
MFRQLARWFQTQNPPPADQVAEALRVLTLHPMELSRFLEEVWRERANAARSPHLAVPVPLQNQEGISFLDQRLQAVPDDIYPAGGRAPNILWEHLIYAYMVENTRIFEVFFRVCRELALGERLGVPTRPDTQIWLRNTEELFFRDAPNYQIYSLTSYLRPDIRATRRNAYWRLFGMDLNHGEDGSRSYPYVKANAANTEFVPVFEELLREVWRGIENDTNAAGPNQTDDAAIAALARRLQEMLTVRRLTGNLSREELVAVAAMSWFHLTIEFNSPVVLDLQAEATSPDERLRKIGERVGLPPHLNTFSHLELALAMSPVLIQIEDGRFNNPGNAPALYRQLIGGVVNPLRENMMRIIDHWSIATGRDMKARRVTVTPRVRPPAAAQPPAAPRPPTASAAATPSANGQVAVARADLGV